jgi:hypothetical protein
MVSVIALRSIGGLCFFAKQSQTLEEDVKIHYNLAIKTVSKMYIEAKQ